MNVSYKGVKTELSSKIQQKLDAKFAKVSKLLEKRGEKEAHVVITSERHLHHAEITLQFYDHQLVSICSDADLFTALSNALDKLEQQALKQRTKWREKTRRSDSLKETMSDAAVTEPATKSENRPAAGNSTKRSSDTNGAKRQGKVSKAVAKNGAKNIATRDGDSAQRVYRVNHHEQRKPMTLDEAVLEMEGGLDYLVYRDTENESVSVLVRRPDGNFDLVES